MNVFKDEKIACKEGVACTIDKITSEVNELKLE